MCATVDCFVYMRINCEFCADALDGMCTFAEGAPCRTGFCYGKVSHATIPAHGSAYDHARV